MIKHFSDKILVTDVILFSTTIQNNPVYFKFLVQYYSFLPTPCTHLASLRIPRKHPSVHTIQNQHCPFPPDSWPSTGIPPKIHSNTQHIISYFFFVSYATTRISGGKYRSNNYTVTTVLPCCALTGIVPTYHSSIQFSLFFNK